jgi:hypothetical protein
MAGCAKRWPSDCKASITRDVTLSPDGLSINRRANAGLVPRMEEPGDHRADLRTHHVIFPRLIDRVSLGCVLVALYSLQVLGFLVSV